MKRKMAVLVAVASIGLAAVGCDEEPAEPVCPTESVSVSDPQAAALSAPELFGDKGGTTGGGRKSGTSKSGGDPLKKDTNSSSGGAAGGVGSTSRPSEKPTGKNKKHFKVDDDLFEDCDS